MRTWRGWDTDSPIRWRLPSSTPSRSGLGLLLWSAVVVPATAPHMGKPSADLGAPFAAFPDAISAGAAVWLRVSSMLGTAGRPVTPSWLHCRWPKSVTGQLLYLFKE